MTGPNSIALSEGQIGRHNREQGRFGNGVGGHK